MMFCLLYDMGGRGPVGAIGALSSRPEVHHVTTHWNGASRSVFGGGGTDTIKNWQHSRVFVASKRRAITLSGSSEITQS